MRAGIFAILTLLAATAAAQTTMFKCKDDRGGVTYSNISCDKQGLKDAGPVADRTTTLPMAAPAAPKPPAPPSKPGAPKGDSETGMTQAPAQVKPASPLIEKLLK